MFNAKQPIGSFPMKGHMPNPDRLHKVGNVPYHPAVPTSLPPLNHPASSGSAGSGQSPPQQQQQGQQQGSPESMQGRLPVHSPILNLQEEASYGSPGSNRGGGAGSPTVLAPMQPGAYFGSPDQGGPMQAAFMQQQMHMQAQAAYMQAQQGGPRGLLEPIPMAPQLPPLQGPYGQMPGAGMGMGMGAPGAAAGGQGAAAGQGAGAGGAYAHIGPKVQTHQKGMRDLQLELAVLKVRRAWAS